MSLQCGMTKGGEGGVRARVLLRSYSDAFRLLEGSALTSLGLADKCRNFGAADIEAGAGWSNLTACLKASMTQEAARDSARSSERGT